MISFSIIIPNYNHGKFLHQRINSILCQTYQNFELIILDDASTDNSLEIIENFKDHPGISHIIYNKTNSGSPFKQWVQGIILAKNNWIWMKNFWRPRSSIFL
jgi:glycosyltransferase involved in cell wall biosynthesis